MPRKLKSTSTRSQVSVAPVTVAMPQRNMKGVSRSARRRRNRRSRSGGSSQVNSNSGGSRVGGTSVFGSNAKYTSNVNSLPSAFVNIDSNGTWTKSLGAVRNNLTGTEGVAFAGCQPLTTVTMTNTAADVAVFTTATLATASADASAVGTCLIHLSPDILNGRIAAISNLYTQFVFRDVVLEYVSNCATSQANSMVLAYIRDSAEAVLLTNTFSTTRQIQPSMTFPFRADRTFFHYHYSGNEIFYAESTTAGDSTRLSRQGTFIGVADTAQGNVPSLGYINIWYVVELYNPVPSQGITLSKEEKTLIKRFREEKKESSTDCVTGCASASSLSLSPVREADGDKCLRTCIASDYVDVKSTQTVAAQHECATSKVSAQVLAPPMAVSSLSRLWTK